MLFVVPILYGAASPEVSQVAPAPPLTIDQAVALALESSPEIQAMTAERQMAVAQTRMAQSMTRPQISANAYLGTGSMESVLPAPPGVMPGNYNLAPRLPFATQNLTLMAPLSTAGRLEGAVRSARARESATLAEVTEMRLQVTLMVREAFLQALRAQEMIRVAQARQEAARAMQESAKAQFDAGKGILASLQRAEAEVADAERMVLAARNDREKMLLELRVAMGAPLDTPLTLAETLPPIASAGALEPWLQRAREGRPALQAGQARIDETRVRSRVARDAGRPQVYGMVMGDAFRSREMGDGGGYSAALLVSLPLIDGGQRRAEREEARAAEARAVAGRRTAELRVEREVRAAWLDAETALHSVRSAEAGLAAAQAAYEVIALRVQNQKSILVEQVEALATLTQARASLAQTRFDHALARARLLRAAGSEEALR